MPIELVIDTRERALIEKLQENNAVITVETLDLGDIVFRTESEIILVIERKTISDLKASICDGRSREQKSRLIGNYPKNRLMYLIEGSLNKQLTDKISGLPVGTLLGSLINTMFRDGIHVYKTGSMDETVNFLVKTHEKLDKELDQFFSDADAGGISDAKYVASLKKPKKTNMTPTVWFMNQLCLVPQVTEKIAEKIVEKYPSMSALMAEYERTPEKYRDGMLADITYLIKDNKSRRVGEKVSVRIYQYVYGISNDE